MNSLVLTCSENVRYNACLGKKEISCLVLKKADFCYPLRLETKRGFVDGNDFIKEGMAILWKKKEI